MAYAAKVYLNKSIKKKTLIAGFYIIIQNNVTYLISNDYYE